MDTNFEKDSFIDNTGLYDRPGQYEKLSKIQDLENDRAFVARLFERQYVSFDNFGIDITLQYPEELFTIELYQEFLIYIDSYLLGISFLDTILLDQEKVKIYALIIYRTLFVEFNKEIVEPYLSTFGIERSKILKDDLDDIRENILLIFTNNIRRLESIEAELQKDLSAEKFEYFVLLELFDNDFDNFYDHYLIQVLNMDT